MKDKVFSLRISGVSSDSEIMKALEKISSGGDGLLSILGVKFLIVNAESTAHYDRFSTNHRTIGGMSREFLQFGPVNIEYTVDFDLIEAINQQPST